jgi:hypothetical protein
MLQPTSRFTVGQVMNQKRPGYDIWGRLHATLTGFNEDGAFGHVWSRGVFLHFFLTINIIYIYRNKYYIVVIYELIPTYYKIKSKID